MVPLCARHTWITSASQTVGHPECCSRRIHRHALPNLAPPRETLERDAPEPRARSAPRRQLGNGTAEAAARGRAVPGFRPSARWGYAKDPGELGGTDEVATEGRSVPGGWAHPAAADAGVAGDVQGANGRGAKLLPRPVVDDAEQRR